ALQGQQAHAQTRLNAVDAALANNGPLATVISATADEVASLRARVLSVQSTDRDLAERVTKLEGADTESARALEILRSRVENLAPEAPGQPERLSAMELSVADLRINQHAAAASSADEANQAVLAVRARLADLEDQQADAFHRLRNDISQFIAD